MRRPPSSFASRCRGSVVVVVLALVTLAAVMLEQFMERSLTEMLIESRVRMSDRMRADAHSGLEAALAVLAGYQESDQGLHSPAQGWGEPLAGLDWRTRSGATVEVRVEDESSRPSLPRLDAPALGALGRQLGLKDRDAADLADALLAWTRAEHNSGGAATDPRNYETENPPHHAPGRPLESFRELAAIAVARQVFYSADGRPNELQAQFARAVSLYNFPAANLNTAGAETLALAGLDATQVRLVRDYVGGRTHRPPGVPPYFRSLAEAQAQLGATVPLTGFDTLARCLRITVVVRQGAASFQLTAVVRPAGMDPDPAAPAGADANANATATDAANAAPATEDTLHYPFVLLALEENIALAPLPTS
jgi:general secretion pathway protein K